MEKFNVPTEKLTDRAASRNIIVVAISAIDKRRISLRRKWIDIANC